MNRPSVGLIDVLLYNVILKETRSVRTIIFVVLTFQRHYCAYKYMSDFFLFQNN